jgi:GNAT superfamily N-acetyltransferase
MNVERFDDAGSFLARAEPWLLEAEAENNLILAVAHRLLATAPGESAPYLAPYLAVLASGGAVQGCAFRTPPMKLGITRMPRSAIPLLVEDVRRVYGAIPGVLGPVNDAGAFAAAWSEHVGARTVEGMRQGIYRLERVRPPRAFPNGRLRPATPEDRELAVRWSLDFIEEVDVDHRDVETGVSERIAAETLWFWDDGEPRSMAAEGGRTPNGSRIGWVFTPPEWRGRGYASACVAEASRRLLAAGRRFCFLYTDLANPTSNALYQRIGYEWVCEAIDYRFSDD